MQQRNNNNNNERSHIHTYIYKCQQAAENMQKRMPQENEKKKTTQKTTTTKSEIKKHSGSNACGQRGRGTLLACFAISLLKASQRVAVGQVRRSVMLGGALTYSATSWAVAVVAVAKRRQASHAVRDLACCRWVNCSIAFLQRFLLFHFALLHFGNCCCCFCFCSGSAVYVQIFIVLCLLLFWLVFRLLTCILVATYALLAGNFFAAARQRVWKNRD